MTLDSSLDFQYVGVCLCSEGIHFLSSISSATMKEDCMMKTMGKSYGKMITCIVFLLVFLILHSNTTSAQSTPDSSICVYKETRQNVPINPKTNQPYTPDERNQEPF